MKIFSITTMDPSVPAQPPSQQDMERMDELISEFKGKGVIIETGGRWPGLMALKIARKNGSTTITDGPFTESKEVVGGFALLDVKDRDEAISVTNRFLELAGNATCTVFLHEVQLA